MESSTTDPCQSNLEELETQAKTWPMHADLAQTHLEKQGSLNTIGYAEQCHYEQRIRRGRPLLQVGAVRPEGQVLQTLCTYFLPRQVSIWVEGKAQSCRILEASRHHRQRRCCTSRDSVWDVAARLIADFQQVLHPSNQQREQEHVQLHLFWRHFLMGASRPLHDVVRHLTRMRRHHESPELQSETAFHRSSTAEQIAWKGSGIASSTVHTLATWRLLPASLSSLRSCCALTLMGCKRFLC